MPKIKKRSIMEPVTALKGYINTPHRDFNRFALRLYFENTKLLAFADPAKPLEIFKFIFDKIREKRDDFFSFVEEYELFTSAQKLTASQNLLLYHSVKNFLKTIVSKRDIDFETCYEDYLSYFKMLEEMAISRDAETVISNTDITAMLNDIVQKQVIRLSDDLNNVPVAQKVKVITSLVRVMPEYRKMKKEPAKFSEIVLAPSDMHGEVPTSSQRAGEMSGIPDDLGKMKN
jgi:hypothetical protein